MIKNREVFITDPTTFTIPNDGVTKVLTPRTSEEWEVLRYELTHFVCEGEYYRGLERILSTFLTNLERFEQPAVWVSGFYGSGKSHFVRVLEYLWRDVQFPDGASTRGLTTLPRDIQDHFQELTIQGKRNGGLWSAAGTLGAGAGRSVRLALLGILFRNAGLPDQYAPARFVIWLHQNDYYENVKHKVEGSGKDFAIELNNMYVSPVLAKSLLEVYPDFANSPADARGLLKVQYPNRDDISDEEMLLTLEDILAMQSDAPGKNPLTLLVFDELQQFIGEDPERALQVQTIVEACSSRFGSQLLFVATGQAALQATPQLQKLVGRFTVRVMLEDKDVETVVRQVVLQKKENKKSAIKAVLEKTSGEIDRQLAGTKIGPRSSDVNDLVPDYPLLPVRRRFWESVLRAIDAAGTAGQLRTQLRIVHEANRYVAESPLGNVVPTDFIFDQLRSDMLQSSVLLRDIDFIISEQTQKAPDGLLRSRLCALIFLIGKLPTEGAAITGVRSTESTLADLIVEDLPTGSTELRQHIPMILKEMVEEGILMQVDDEYRLQTRESAEWETDFRKRYARIHADDSRIASDRTEDLRMAVQEALKALTFTQGVNKIPRKYELHFGVDTPESKSGNVPVWIRDEWSVSERVVREDSQLEGTESPVVFVFIPRVNADAFKTALASRAAAKETLDSRPRPSTAEGIEARSAMEARHRLESNKVKGLVLDTFNTVRVYQGGGLEIQAGNLTACLQVAIENSLERLFPELGTADVPGWGTVVRRAGEGAPDALAAIGHQGDVDKNPATKLVRDYIGGSGKRGLEVRKKFQAPPYGWPQDAIDGSILSLMAGGFVRGTKNGQSIQVKEISQSLLPSVEFFSEGVTISALQRIQVRKLIIDMGLPVKAGEEADAIPLILDQLLNLAGQAGGDAPLPRRPHTHEIEDLRSLSGNEQFVAVYEKREMILKNYSDWDHARSIIAQRKPRWDVLNQMLHHAESLPVSDEVRTQVETIQLERSLLADPDPLKPLIQKLSDALRNALQQARSELENIRQHELSNIETSQDWQSLQDAERKEILLANSLGPVPELNIGTEGSLLATLDTSSLSLWENKIAALPSWANKAREEVARRLEPQAVRVYPPRVTLKTREDVEAYLDSLHQEIMKHIDDGKPVIL